MSIALDFALLGHVTNDSELLIDHPKMERSPPYDVNFCFAAPDALENDRVKLVPFIVGDFPIPSSSHSHVHTVFDLIGSRTRCGIFCKSGALPSIVRLSFIRAFQHRGRAYWAS